MWSAANATMIGDMDSQTIKKYLFKKAMKSEWEGVVQAYQQNKRAHKVRITKSGDTALHIAVLDGQDERVEELVSLVSLEELKIQNERGNTPLHFAAAQGNVRMCRCIARVRPSLIRILNNDKETPLFLAALHGKTDAFLLLHYIRTPNKSDPEYYSYCRREDGDTILHCAISGEYYDLAFQIIALYEDLVNSVNGVGLSPLHLMASQPSAFRSGSHLSHWKRIIYNCILVDELNVEDADHFHERVTNTINNEKAPKYPENYRSCINMLLVLWKMARIFVTHTAVDNRIDRKKSTDLENPKETSEGNSTDLENPKETSEGNSGPYDTCFNFVKLLSKAMLIVLGSSELKKIRNKKKRHIWAVQIVAKLLKSAVMYEYEDTAMNPPASSHNDGETRPYHIISDGRVTLGGDIGDGDLTTFGSIEEQPMTQGAPVSTLRDSETRRRPYYISDVRVTLGDIDERRTLPPSSTTGMDTPILIAAKNGVIEVSTLRDSETRRRPYYISDGRFTLGDIDERWTLPPSSTTGMDTPILIAAKYGVIEVVKKIMELFPIAIYDVDSKQRNIVLLAAENKQTNMYQMLLRKMSPQFDKVDIDWNSALHLAAKLGNDKPWRAVGPALHMQWEVKWFEYVKTSMGDNFFSRFNKDNKTAEDIFTESHFNLVEKGARWVSKTSETCTLVATFIATVSFSTVTTIPGGVNEDSGSPLLANQPAFDVYAVSSLLALCFSMTSMFIFLSILLSQNQQKDFAQKLPWKILLGLTSLFVSTVSMMVSFCAGHFFMLKYKLGSAALPLYAMTCLPIAYFVVTKFPLYISLISANFSKIPAQRTDTDPL